MSRLTASECPHPGAVKHIHTISVPLNQATLALCLLLHKSSTFGTALCTCCTLVDDIADDIQSNNGHNGQMVQ